MSEEAEFCETYGLSVGGCDVVSYAALNAGCACSDPSAFTESGSSAGYFHSAR